MTHFLSTSAGLAENVLIFASIDGIAPAKNPRVAHLSFRTRAPGQQQRSRISTIFQWGGSEVLFHRETRDAWRNRIGRGRVGDEILLTFRANGDVGHRQPFAELDKPGLGQKILLRRTL